MGASDDKKIDILLAEYQNTLGNRNHYESVQWTIGTLFIAASLTSLGVSFLRDVSCNSEAVLMICIFSLLLVGVWVAYNLHSQPYVDTSHLRLQQIEKEIRRLARTTYPTLHKDIHEAKKGRRLGTYITISMVLVLVSAWLTRVWLLFRAYPLALPMLLGLWIVILCTLLLIYPTARLEP
jgi:hypothetical protein